MFIHAFRLAHDSTMLHNGRRGTLRLTVMSSWPKPAYWLTKNVALGRPMNVHVRVGGRAVSPCRTERHASLDYYVEGFMHLALVPHCAMRTKTPQQLPCYKAHADQRIPCICMLMKMHKEINCSLLSQDVMVHICSES